MHLAPGPFVWSRYRRESYRRTAYPIRAATTRLSTADAGFSMRESMRLTGAAPRTAGYTRCIPGNWSATPTQTDLT